MDTNAAREFIRQHHRAVLATRTRDGGIQQSPVLVAVDAYGRVLISSRETAYKTKNVQREPWAQVCVFTDEFFGAWVIAEGDAEVLALPEAMDPLIEYFRAVSGEHPNWDEYRDSMHRERRVAIRIDIRRAGPDAHG